MSAKKKEEGGKVKLVGLSSPALNGSSLLAATDPVALAKLCSRSSYTHTSQKSFLKKTKKTSSYVHVFTVLLVKFGNESREREVAGCVIIVADEHKAVACIIRNGFTALFTSYSLDDLAPEV